MASHRRGASISSQRPLAVKAETHFPVHSHGTPDPLREVRYHHSAPRQTMFQAPLEPVPHRSSTSIVELNTRPSIHMTVSDRLEPVEYARPSQQRLPSLRELIDVPPKQTSPRLYPPQHASPDRITVHIPTQPNGWYAGCSTSSPVSNRPFNVPHPQGPHNMHSIDERVVAGKRPSAGSASRPHSYYGHATNTPAMSSPRSATTSVAASGFHADRGFSSAASSTPINRPAAFKLESPDYSRADAAYRDAHHLSLVTDRRTSLAPAGPAIVPRCVGQERIPGKGLCYIYEDGSFCEAVVRGEAVNPEWGLTRAGRARKRLAKACNSCREKKVKCEPGTSYHCQRCSRKGQDCVW